MAQVTCRCGEILKVTSRDPDRLTCPRCGARIRVRRSRSRRVAGAAPNDGYARFHCSCGRRLKVRIDQRPEAGKCPDCGRTVPVPESVWQATTDAVPGLMGGTQSHPLARTQDMDAADLLRLEQWASRFQAESGLDQQPGLESTASHEAGSPTGRAASAGQSPPPVMKMEAGLRVCKRCGKPLHMSATVCRSCGEPVPR